MEKFYVLIGIMLLTLGQPAKSQIVYTDIVPDSVLITIDQWNPMFMDIDPNNNGIPDFVIAHHGGVQFFSGYGDGSEVLIEQSHEYMQPRVLNYGDSIDDTKSNWFNSFHSSLNLTHGWAGQYDKYIGLRLKIYGQWHYGWLRISIPDDDQSCIVKDFAYNSIPGMGIKAGETTISDVIEQDKDEILTLNFGDELFIKLNGNNNEPVTCNLYSLTGNLLKSEKFQGNEFLMNLEGYIPGIAFVVIQNSNKIYVKKLLFNI